MTEHRPQEFGGTEGVDQLHREEPVREATLEARAPAPVPEEEADSRQVGVAGEERLGKADKNGTTDDRHEATSWHADAGRKGALRIHELIREGRLYEQEHGLSRGRQRIRQLIQEGKLYEQEQGLRPTSQRAARSRSPRMSKQQLLKSLFHSLVRLAKPSLRAELVRLVQEVEAK
jgi:hypothetical protein